VSGYASRQAAPPEPMLEVKPCEVRGCEKSGLPMYRASVCGDHVPYVNLALSSGGLDGQSWDAKCCFVAETLAQLAYSLPPHPLRRRLGP
jgi:hypothetical protein